MSDLSLNARLITQGLKSPWTRTLIVDAGGKGDYTTIQAAVNAAYTGGANNTTRWRVLVPSGTFVEDVAMATPGIDLVGTARDATIIQGRVTASCGNNICNLKIVSSTLDEALVMTAYAGVSYTVLKNVDARADRSWAGLTTALKVSGPGTAITSVIYLDGCNFYANNPNASSSAIANSVHLDSGVNGTYLECMGGTYFKTSTGASGGGLDLGIWSEASGASYVEVNAGTIYRCAWQKTRPVEVVRNSNTSFTGVIGTLAFYASDTLGYAYTDPHASVDANLYVNRARIFEARHDLIAMRYIKLGARRFSSAAAAPTTGAWIVGDIVYNSAPAASGFIGWVCVTAGTPGTWKTFGAISA